jgi:hypothetical protein
LFRPRCQQKETASGAKSTPMVFSAFPSCFKMEPVPQPASKISFSHPTGQFGFQCLKDQPMQCLVPPARLIDAKHNAIFFRLH